MSHTAFDDANVMVSLLAIAIVQNHIKIYSPDYWLYGRYIISSGIGAGELYRCAGALYCV